MVALIDIDGVVLHREMYFSTRLARDYGIDSNLIGEFFKTEFYHCVVGKKDLKEALVPYLDRWGWEKGIDALLEFWYSTDGVLDDQVLAEIDELRRKGVKCYFATDNEKHRLAYILDTIGLRDRVEGVFGSSELHVTKEQKEFWDMVVEKLNVPCEEIVFVDDDKKNVELAQSVGVMAYVFEKGMTLAEVFSEVPSLHFL